MNILERFLKYVAIDTQSCQNSNSYPSTHSQLYFMRELLLELRAMGIEHSYINKDGYLIAHIEGNCTDMRDTIGFIAHVDTSPDMSGSGVSPKVIECYNGEDIVLNEAQNIVMRTTDFPELLLYKGQTLITTDGTTLLGADDKAGVAEIMTAIHYLVSNPEVIHAPLSIAFTPDEEIGRGVDYFNVEAFGAKYAYTMDGGRIGGIEYETFNAASATLKVAGRNVHPGYAKRKMVNALRVLMAFDQLLPECERPETTEGFEGFYHLTSIEGGVDSAQASYIIRDHSHTKFEERKKIFEQLARSLSGDGCQVSADITDQYYNMGQIIKDNFYIVERALEAMRAIGVTPEVEPVRGGTDGSRLSYMGLPTPNLFAGGENFHGRYEFVSLQSMEKAVQLIIEIAKMK